MSNNVEQQHLEKNVQTCKHTSAGTTGDYITKLERIIIISRSGAAYSDTEVRICDTLMEQEANRVANATVTIEIPEEFEAHIKAVLVALANDHQNCDLT